ncbi:transglycosylase SLT domain-containing protein [Shimia thalassica]|uniref:transglycosylase SLT domain-containing protein n=1 Tax=Shimia thalassica TaxID=1715693 RepID=UPI0026E119AF|nr:transglycosylase SLT domain-containing protein [Shimia thalassica]MDO6483851.1 transglycosylase SLT domain-containing protein [Shimia thalassica]
MSRFFRALVIVVLVGSCGGGYNTPPHNLDDACAILKQRPQFIKAFKATKRKWDIPVNVQMAILYQESKFDADARTPYRYVLGVLPMGRQSSAYGYAQALDATWEQYKQETGRRSAKRDDIRDATDFMGWYMNITRSKNGIALDDARRQYLAYHEGHTGYARGSYKKKPWLMRVSGEVEDRAEMYRFQIEKCARIR